MDSIDYIAEAQRLQVRLERAPGCMTEQIQIIAAALKRAELRGREGEAGMCAGLAYAELRKHLGAAACMGFTVLDRRVAQLAAERERLAKEGA